MNIFNLHHNRNVARDESAVIVGASLSGLMTGIALAREGIRVTIVDKVGEGQRTGAGLRVDGGEYGESRTARFLRNLVSGGRSSIQLWSSIESRLRAEVLRYPSIALRYNTRVQSVNQDADTAWVETDAGEVIRGDILIGADGHSSLVRRHVAPHKPDARFAGYMVWISSMREEDLPEKYRPRENHPPVTMLDSSNGFLFGSVIEREGSSSDSGNRRIGCTWYDNSRNDLLYHLGCIEGSVVVHSLNGADIPEKTLMELADQATEKWPEPWSSVMRHAVQTRNIIGIPIKEYVPDNLVRGRIGLVGDAAHVPAPVTASGFNESLQDAAVLGECVSKGIHANKAIEALRKYESLRLERVRQMVQSGQFFSQTFRE